MTGSTSAEELSVFSDGEMKENFSFTHSPYGSESVEFEDERLTPTTPRSGNSGPKKNCNVYISNLPAGVDDVWLRKEFGRFGLITSAKVMQAYSKKRVYAFVQFTEEAMAQAAVEGANGVYAGNFPLVVKIADRDKDKGLPNQPSNNLYISNLPFTFTVADLERVFSPFGQICSSVVLTHPHTGIGRGVGLVRFFCVLDATAAIQGLNGKVLEGHDRPLEVKYAEDSETKQVRKMPKKQPETKAAEPSKLRGSPKLPSPPQIPKAATRGIHGPGGDSPPLPTVSSLPDLLQLSEQFGQCSLEPSLHPKPVLPPPDPQASVYIGGLPRDLQVLHAYQLFAPFGALASIDLQPDPRADTSYAYIQYRWHHDAQHAVEQLDGAILAGRRLYSTIHSPHNHHTGEFPTAIRR